MRSSLLAGSVLLCVLTTIASTQTITNTFPGTFVDLSTTGGTAVPGVGDDTVHQITTTIGNAMFPAGPVMICNNGWAMANPATAPAYGPYSETDIPLPTGMPTGFTNAGITSPGNGLLLPWWDDLYANPCCSNAMTIYWQEAAGVLTIMWKNDNHFADATAGAGITFEIQVFSSPGTGPWIQYLYSDTVFGGAYANDDNAASATIGYVKSTNAVGSNAKWSFDTVGAVTAGSVISIYPPMGLYGVGAASPGTVFQGGSSLLTIAMSATTPPIPPTGVLVAIDLSLIGGSPAQPMYDDGLTGGDVTAGDNTFSFTYNVPLATPPATYLLPWNASDSAARTTSGVLSLTVTAIPPVNDGCANPIALSFGANGPFSNASATSSGIPMGCGSGGYDDVWFSYTPACSTQVNVTTGCGGFDTILAAYAGCGGASLACNDNTAGCASGGSTISFAATVGTTYLLQVASYFSGTSGTFSVNISHGGGAFAVAFSEPGGPGSATIQIDFTNGPPSGLYFLAVTFNQGLFPAGWFYGVDISFPELSALISLGSPFLASLDACGAHTIGPFGGAGFLQGIPIYAVALGIPQPGPLFPTVHTTPVTFTIL